jgi:pimeloyl-ACP methyl ester carboxylesterase
VPCLQACRSVLTPFRWDGQSLSQVASHGFRAIAHNRSGHGDSSQPWDGNDLDTYADDLAELIEALDLHDVGLTPPLARARFTPLGYRIDRDRPRRAFARA